MAEFSLSNLLHCHESESSLNDDEEERSEQEQKHSHCFTTTTIIIGEDDEVYVAELVRKENHQKLETDSSKTTSSLDRLIAIDWILTTRTRFGFQHQTAYIAISYFDLFLKKRFIGLQRDESWAIRLLSVACLSIAAKMEERIVPGLSQYPQDQDFVFKPDVILKTELLILSTLDWKLNLITPFHYFHYFISKFGTHIDDSSVLLASSESLLALTKEISFTDYRQFVVAAAIVVSSSTSSLSREEMKDKFRSISWWTSNENENVYLCYERIKEIEERKHHMTPPPAPPEIAVSGDVKPLSGSGVKRRLSFDDDTDQTTTPAKRMRRL